MDSSVVNASWAVARLAAERVAIRQTAVERAIEFCFIGIGIS
jgi:hypothetical protein